jgi:hypothetical protein
MSHCVQLIIFFFKPRQPLNKKHNSLLHNSTTKWLTLCHALKLLHSNSTFLVCPWQVDMVIMKDMALRKLLWLDYWIYSLMWWEHSVWSLWPSHNNATVIRVDNKQSTASGCTHAPLFYLRVLNLEFHILHIITLPLILKPL